MHGLTGIGAALAALSLGLAAVTEARAQGTPPTPQLEPPAVQVAQAGAFGLGAIGIAADEGAAAMASAVFLSDADVGLYRAILDAQEIGNWGAADRLIAQLGDTRLMGHVLFQRYMHPTAWRSNYAELASWLERYADVPGADRIYDLAVRRAPAGASPARAVAGRMGLGRVERYGLATCDYTMSVDSSSEADRRVREFLRSSAPEDALAYLDSRAGSVPATDVDRLRADIAAILVFGGRDREALAVAQPSFERSGALVPRASWIAGLASWQLGEYASAARFFEATARSECYSAWGRTGGAYWAARAHWRAGAPQHASRWLREAAAYPHTFYGLLAARTLGQDVTWRFDAPRLTVAHMAALVEEPAALRAIGLMQLGRIAEAEAEMLRIPTQNGSRVLQEAILGLAQANGLAATAARVSTQVERPDGTYWDGGLYPIVAYNPPGGFTVDRALVHALMRQESRFDAQAVSRAGATGLMQLMPRTASFTSGRDFTGSNAALLTDPELNLRIAQDHIADLLADPSVGSGLIDIFASYNAGSGNLVRWRRDLPHGDDPLLFMELVPFAETRAYLERVLVNLWIYRIQLGQPNPSLDQLAAGQWPTYRRMDRPANLPVASHVAN